MRGETDGLMWSGINDSRVDIERDYTIGICCYEGL